jgi:phosphoribosylamine-glycine ligase
MIIPDMKAITITAYTEDASQIEAIKAVIKAFKIKYKISKTQITESPYDPEFVDMIKQGEKDLKNGKGIKMTLDELEDLCK